jgi:hypothetical protein
MKRLAIALGTGLLMVTVLVAPALGAAQKVEMVPCPTELSSGCHDAAGPGGGFVVFNNSGGPNNLHVTVALKGVTPETAYDIWLFVDQTATGAKLGTVTTNEVGNATFHVNTAVVRGEHDLGIDVTRAGSGFDLYLSSGFYHAGMSATLTFK